MIGGVLSNAMIKERGRGAVDVILFSIIESF